MFIGGHAQRVTDGEHVSPLESRTRSRVLHMVSVDGPITAAELDEGATLLASLRPGRQGKSQAWPEAWIGLCTATLSGPRLLYQGLLF